MCLRYGIILFFQFKFYAQILEEVSAHHGYGKCITYENLQS